MLPRWSSFLCCGLVLLSVPLAAVPATEKPANPFFSPYGTPQETPPFDRITVDHFLPAIQEGIRRQQAEVDAIVADKRPATFANTVAALDASGQFLERVNLVFYNGLDAVTSPAMEAVAKEISPLLAAHGDNIDLNPGLFARVKAVYDARATLKLTPAQSYLLENVYRGFVRSGALLDDSQKARMRDINRELSLLELKYNENVLAETNGSYLVIDRREDLAGLPEGIVAQGEETGKSMGLAGKWVFTTQRPSWTPFLQYSERCDLRQALYTSYLMRANRDNERDNKGVLQKILVLRAERCAMLGFPSPAHFYLEDRMARTPEAVDKFLRELWAPALARAQAELKDMTALAEREKAPLPLASWDWWYYAEKVRREKYALDDAALRPYFKLENVKQGVFTLAEKLYGVRFVPRHDIPLYHPDVQVVEVREGNGTLLGILYMDFFPRDSKRGGAWSGGYRGSWKQDGKRVLPLATIVCNFTKPTASAPSLLSIDEVTTFFHEFGHSLNGLFANGEYRGNYAPQDSVELPSQIMENWALEPELLKLYARHYRTGEVIPAALVDKLKQSRLFNQGFETVEYLASAILDMAWHSLPSALNHNVDQFEADTLRALALIPQIEPRWRSSYFTHIISGYSAGYYSYIWAGVLDSDAFEAFRETSLFDRKTAAAFRKNILEKLGTEDAMTLYKRFRGREPKPEPLLKRRGLL
ncbi:MAG TPA: M3 family metallopeptidase [Candidatus Aminicenantes bacterium]|nr:M3 family metallopeptidase [Candidatus Aminicenantes bacterium]